jgi:hypothetical protein
MVRTSIPGTGALNTKPIIVSKLTTSSPGKPHKENSITENNFRGDPPILSAIEATR